MPAFASKTWSLNEGLTSSDLNTYVRDPLLALSPATLTAQTIGATLAALYQFTVPTNSALLMWGHVIGERNDHSAALLARFGATYRRGAGNIAIAGSYCDVSKDTASALNVQVLSFNPDVAYIVVSGVASQTWNWRVVGGHQWL